MSAYRPPALVANVGFALLCLIWGSTWLVIRTGLEDLPPFTSLAIRFSVAAAVFIAVAGPLHRREGGKRPSLALSFIMGACSFAGPYGILYWAEVVIPSGLASVLWAVFPMLMAISGHFFLPGEQLGLRHWVGFGAGFLGVLLLFQTDLRSIGGEAMVVGAVYLLSPLISAVGQTFVKRFGQETSSLLLNRNALVIATLLVWAVALPAERGAPITWTGTAIFSIAYLSIMGTCVTFGIFFWLLRFYPSNRMSLIAYVIPVVALILGASVGDEPVGWHTLGGTALVLGGVGLVAERKKGE